MAEDFQLDITASAGSVPLTGVVSRKTHGIAGEFNVDLPLAGILASNAVAVAQTAPTRLSSVLRIL